VNAEIENLLDQLTSIRQDAPGLLARLSPAECAWRPTPHTWSIGDCFAHLNLTAEASLPVLAAAISQARQRGLTADGPFVYSWFERTLAQSMEPGAGMRFRARRRFNPQAIERDPAGLLAEFMTWQDGIDAAIRSAEGLDLRRVRMPSPVAPLLRYSLGTGFAILLAHERRHLWQARNVRGQLEARGRRSEVRGQNSEVRS
jgi:hypothetical protein